MKKTLLILSFALCSLSVFSQNPPPQPPPPLEDAPLVISKSKMGAIKRLLEATGGTKMGAAILDNIVTTYRSAGVPLGAAMWDEAVKEANVGALIDAMIPLYHKYYTEQEIEALITFYQSPIGKKTIAVMPMLMQESMLIGQQWGAAIWERVQKKMKEKQG